MFYSQILNKCKVLFNLVCSFSSCSSCENESGELRLKGQADEVIARPCPSPVQIRPLSTRTGPAEPVLLEETEQEEGLHGLPWPTARLLPVRGHH